MSDDTDGNAAVTPSNGNGDGQGGNGGGGNGGAATAGGGPELPEPQSGVLSLAFDGYFLAYPGQNAKT